MKFIPRVLYRTSCSASGHARFALPSGRSDDGVDGLVEPTLAVVLGLDHLEESPFDAQLGHGVEFAVGANEGIR